MVHPVVVATLDDLLAAHLREPFPVSVEKGRDYGDVDPVMIGADIYGWASKVARTGGLTAEDTRRLVNARDELVRSLVVFPSDARAYFQRLLHLAEVALGSDAPPKAPNSP